MKPLIANSLWFASCWPEAAAYHRALGSVEETQWRVLQGILRRHAEYADLRSVAEFQARVPLSDEPRATAEPVIRRVPTSGTSGPTKFIPYTPSLLAEFQRGIAPWIADLFRHEPRLLAGKSYWAISPVTETGAVFGDDTEYLGPARRWVSSTLAVPAAVRQIRDLDEWRSVTLRHLVACRDLAFISVWHPSFLSLLIEPVRERVTELWPNLRVISCWADAAAERPAAALARLFPQARLQPKGLIATEGFVSLPLWGRDGAALAVRSHFFEFLDEFGHANLAHELAAGGEYSVVLTTGGGLYRYRLRDWVRVVGFERACPLLRFIGKEDHVADWFGEKLTEQQVRPAVDRLLARQRISPAFVMLACAGRAYTLFVEADEATDGALARLGTELDAALRENFHYRYCQQLGQLGSVQVFRIHGRGVETYLTECQARGRRLGEVKPLVLQRDGGWAEVFAGHYLSSPAHAGCAGQSPTIGEEVQR